MKLTRSKTLLACVVFVSLALLAGIAYAVELPPFEEKVGDIRASDVCATMGSGSTSAAALKRVLPEKSSYSFDDSLTDLRLDATDDTYQTDCTVDGGGEQLAWTGTELLEYDTTEAWAEEVLGQYDSVSALTPFTAGDKALASSKVAAVYLPCTSHGADRHLSVVVNLKKKGSAGDSTLRSGLITLARNAAEYAHTKAKCDTPNKLG
ncbi:hypothetical protein [Streptomyces sp. MBT53]|uniref:hypothetical protein n=1 Tax=Streptomyces sp. MBT53 TaxID=1488384 RepID=UPI0027DAB0FF|nr:hypothetical protein [Streptomyces sp. MBT53]